MPYRKTKIDRRRRFAVPTVGEACSTSSYASPAAHVPSLRQCSYHESGGAQCELEHGHEGRHDFTDALFMFLQARYNKLQGPFCRTRRGPPEYLYVEGPMCL